MDRLQLAHEAVMEAEDDYGAAVKKASEMEAKLRKARGNYVVHHRNYNEAAEAMDVAASRLEAARVHLNEVRREERAVERALTASPVQVELF